MEQYNIDIVGVIGDDYTIKDLKNDIKKADGKDLLLNVDSVGGSFFDGIGQYNLLKEYPGKITTNINSLSASAATYYTLAADHVTAHDNSSMMIHNVFSLVYGDHNTLRKEADENKALSSIISRMYSQKTGTPQSKISEMMDKETWFYGKEIQEAGFSNETIETGQAGEKTACIQEGKAKFKIMVNSLDREKYNNELKQIMNIIQDTTNVNTLENNKQGADKVTKEEILNKVMTLKTNNELTLPELAETLNMSDQIVTKEHTNALTVLNELVEISGKDNVIDFVKELITERENNANLVRESKMTELFGPKKDKKSGKENDVRSYAEMILKDKELSEENINGIKENSIYKKLLAEQADMFSEANKLSTVDDLEKQEITEDANKISVVKL